MVGLWTAADGLLRGRLLPKEELRAGRLLAGTGTLTAVGAVAGGLYGAAMGLFGVLRPMHATWQQVLADAVKVPALFLLTLVVAFPSLYTFSALADSKLRVGDTLKLLLVAIGVNLVLLASFAPVTAFFTVSTTSYSFMVLLNCAFFALSGVIGLTVLSRALHAVYEAPPKPATAFQAAADADPETLRRCEEERRRWSEHQRAAARPRRVFYAWFLIYGLVGSQMGWILRPFIGAPGLEFQLFRAREGSFFEGFFTALGHFLVGR